MYRIYVQLTCTWYMQRGVRKPSKRGANGGEMSPEGEMNKFLSTRLADNVNALIYMASTTIGV